ncbi:dihydrofolate reductase [Telluribacter humicola]|uniref:dihydrofolate reductase n=1 Tax=Telluribacter humicola TaxID=1720261 RepID=UPI001A9725E1|nr:dihydrofolate reductase [Telluribacter humicola]
MIVSFIVAVSENSVIGADNDLPWRLPDDLKRFKRLTMGSPMIMGRKTFESIGKPLPGRTTIILTRSEDYQVEGAEVVHSLEDALKLARSLKTEEVYVIGGGEIFNQAMPQAGRIYLTKVLTSIEGDTFFTIPDLENWQETYHEFHSADERHEYSFIFLDLERKN